jgi:hypothetical protein
LKLEYREPAINQPVQTPTGRGKTGRASHAVQYRTHRVMCQPGMGILEASRKLI